MSSANIVVVYYILQYHEHKWKFCFKGGARGKATGSASSIGYILWWAWMSTASLIARWPLVSDILHTQFRTLEESLCPKCKQFILWRAWLLLIMFMAHLPSRFWPKRGIRGKVRESPTNRTNAHSSPKPIPKIATHDHYHHLVFCPSSEAVTLRLPVAAPIAWLHFFSFAFTHLTFERGRRGGVYGGYSWGAGPLPISSMAVKKG